MQVFACNKPIFILEWTAPGDARITTLHDRKPQAPKIIDEPAKIKKEVKKIVSWNLPVLGVMND